MRKLCFLLCMLLLCSLFSGASAVDGLSFAEGCKYKTNSSVVLYESVDGTLYAGRTLSSGTYLRKNGENAVTKANPGKAYIVCCPDGNSDNLLYGYIDSSAISSATKSYTLKDGKTVHLPEALFNNKSALNFYLQMEYGESVSEDVVINDKYDEPTTDPDGVVNTDAPSSGSLTPAEWSARMAKYSAANGVTTGTAFTDEEGNATPCEIVNLGIARSTIKIGKQKQVVPTSSLTWDHEVSEDRVLAVIKANKQGYAFLRAKKSAKSFSMGHCITGSVVRVIRYGKTWCLIDYQGTRGYVHTSALTFYANNQTDYVTGLLSYKGRTHTRDGSTTVNIRAKAVNGSRILANLPIGTPVTVTATTGKWSEVDCAGYHCFVLTQYVTEDEKEE